MCMSLFVDIVETEARLAMYLNSECTPVGTLLDSSLTPVGILMESNMDYSTYNTQTPRTPSGLQPDYVWNSYKNLKQVFKKSRWSLDGVCVKSSGLRQYVWGSVKNSWPVLFLTILVNIRRVPAPKIMLKYSNIFL